MNSAHLGAEAPHVTLEDGFTRHRISGTFRNAVVEASFMKWAFHRSRPLQIIAAISAIVIIRLAFLIGIHHPAYIVALSGIELAFVGAYFALLAAAAHLKEGEGLCLYISREGWQVPAATPWPSWLRPEPCQPHQSCFC
jgi:hypothetical protein